jgi:hypothetical protein
MEKLSLTTLKTTLEEFKGYVEQYSLEGDLKSSFHAFQDARAIENVIAILSTRDLINNDLVESN